MNPLPCAFRESLPEPEFANCLLASQMVSRDSPVTCRVSPAMCQACLASTRGKSPMEDHPVFPSLVYGVAAEMLETATDAASRAHWEQWIARTEAMFVKQSRPKVHDGPVRACDIVLFLPDTQVDPTPLVESLLAQEGAIPILHIVTGERAHPAIDVFARRWNVHVHVDARVDSRDAAFARVWNGTPLATGHRPATTSLASEFVALLAASDPFDPTWLASSIRALTETGGEVFVAGEAWSSQPHPVATSVVARRATWVDLGFPSVDDQSIQLAIERAWKQGRPFVFGAADEESPRAIIGPNSADIPSGSDRTVEAMDEPFRCDVVLPFCGWLDYVEEALESLLAQRHAEPVIHLIDDCSPGEIDAFLCRWSEHPRVRVYRNVENIGQFQSFNNVAGYFETDHVAVQDADDVSLPWRLAFAGQMLRESGADYFGGAVELFGDDEVIRPVMSETNELERIPRAKIRRSFYPRWLRSDYFLENPTAVFRTRMFLEMGGYADFGDRWLNGTSLDTEFQLRCLYHGARFAIARDVVTRYRVHAQSATQDRRTGWGTSVRAESIRQLEERCRVFRSGPFDPRVFGSLGRYRHLTRPWPGK